MRQVAEERLQGWLQWAEDSQEGGDGSGAAPHVRSRFLHRPLLVHAVRLITCCLALTISFVWKCRPSNARLLHGSSAVGWCRPHQTFAKGLAAGIPHRSPSCVYTDPLSLPGLQASRSADAV